MKNSPLVDWSTSRRGKKGLTLIEVMLAIAILGMGITGLVACTSRCLAVVRKARDYETSRRLFGVLEIEKPLKMEDLKEQEDDGTFSEPYGSFRWRRVIEIVGKEADGLYKMTMTISWADNGKQAEESVVTYLCGFDAKEGGTVESKK